MRTILFLCLFFTDLSLFGQERCATVAYLEATQQRAGERQRIATAENFLKNKTLLKGIDNAAIIRIPVVVHVLYNHPSQNISDAQVQSGMDALNRDFRRKNSDTANTPERFVLMAADTQIEFYLATATPQGRATTGIERKATTRMGWMADDKMKLASQGGLDAWDNKSYLNIWICNLVGGSGYATAPGSSANIDGIVVNYSAFGTIHSSPPFNQGRTAVHEVGHWLGLKHIWGDNECGDDGVADTPQQAYYTKGCPSGLRRSCNNGESGDMYMNYMDYTDDACMNLFTLGQRQRMRAAFLDGGPRASLLQSKGLSTPWISEAPLPVVMTGLYPNPAQDRLTLQTDELQIGKTVQFLSSQGQLIRIERITSPLQSFSIQSLKPGIYFLRGEGFLYRFLKL